ncbi:MAG: DNA mismatch repair protein MutS, partial [candidate division WOR-3 bacterium]
LPHLRRLTPYETRNYLLLDRTTRRNLELVERIHPEESGPVRTGTLLSVLDRTCTPAGARLLRRWLLAPLLDVPAITERHDAVEELFGMDLTGLQQLLSKVGDLERVASRIGLERANARDLVALAGWLAVA